MFRPFELLGLKILRLLNDLDFKFGFERTLLDH